MEVKRMEKSKENQFYTFKKSKNTCETQTQNTSPRQLFPAIFTYSDYFKLYSIVSLDLTLPTLHSTKLQNTTSNIHHT